MQGPAAGATYGPGRLGQIDIEGVEKKEKACTFEELS